MIKTFILANQKMRKKTLPDPSLLDSYCRTIFSKSNLNSDTVISFPMLLNWVQNNPVAIEIFNEFDPGYQLNIRQDYSVFKRFKPFKNKSYIHGLLQYQSIYNRPQTVLTLKRQTEDKISMPDSKYQSHFDFQFQKQKIERLKTAPTSSLLRRVASINKFQQKECRIKKNYQMSVEKIEQSKPFQKDYIIGKKLNYIKRNQIIKNKINHNSVLIINGCTLTQKNVFYLKDYFNFLTDKKDFLTSLDFTMKLEKSYIKAHAGNLFKFLDDKKKGSVSFTDFMLKLYPSLSKQQMKTIRLWSHKHNYFQIADKWHQQYKTNSVNKKRALPQACIKSLQNLFRQFDKENRGYLNVQDLQLIYKQSNLKELEQMIQKRALYPSKGMNFHQFATSILPDQFQIP